MNNQPILKSFATKRKDDSNNRIDCMDNIESIPCNEGSSEDIKYMTVVSKMLVRIEYNCQISN